MPQTHGNGKAFSKLGFPCVHVQMLTVYADHSLLLLDGCSLNFFPPETPHLDE